MIVVRHGEIRRRALPSAPGRCCRREVLAFARGEPYRAREADPIGHQPERVERQGFHDGADIRVAAATQAEQRARDRARRRAGRQAIDHAVDPVAVGDGRRPGHERIGLTRCCFVGPRMRQRQHVDASRRQRFDAIEQRRVAAGAEDPRRAHRQRDLRRIEARLPADAVISSVCASLRKYPPAQA
jgi:hypothetical protein